MRSVYAKRTNRVEHRAGVRKAVRLNKDMDDESLARKLQTAASGLGDTAFNHGDMAVRMLGATQSISDSSSLVSHGEDADPCVRVEAVGGAFAGTTYRDELAAICLCHFCLIEKHRQQRRQQLGGRV